jgi:Arc/MetJ-type ribon-helix-helix transcriptional regulator
MTITLPREQQEWLEAQVKAGYYDSIEDAVASIVAEHMQLDIDDMSWARELVEEGRASLEREGALSLDEHRKRIARKVQELNRK